MDKLIADINTIVDKSDLRILRNVISDRIQVVSSMLKYQLERGDIVLVQGRKLNEEGTIDKVNRTRAVVNINGKLWNVPFSLMTKVQKGENK
jgi:hypothetical protein